MGFSAPPITTMGIRFSVMMIIYFITNAAAVNENVAPTGIEPAASWASTGRSTN